MTRPILIISATSLVGRNLVYEMRKARRADPVATVFPAAPKDTRPALDVRSADAVAALFDHVRPGVVVNTASIASPDVVEKDPAAARRVNLEGTRHLAAAAKKHSARYIHLSSNAVYAGDRPPYSESSPQAPRNEYGKMKVEEDHVIRAAGLRAAIVRPILMYGWNDSAERVNPLTWQLAAQRAGKPLKIVADIFCNPLCVVDTARFILKLIDEDIQGEFNIGGPEKISRHEMALRISRHYKLDDKLIEPVPSSYFPEIAARPVDTTLDYARAARESGYAPLALEPALEYLDANRF